ncbi:MAG: SpaH/EbpB family LPXTG-anchored major pilin [Oscillospiraceae bacterium]|nr:SpaH/EbpB family LPXTG-anchored major pilin [Oscillospiraceae bacterium]
MKKLKRITALILSVLMLMSMSVMVSATANTPTYTLVVNSPDAGYTYTAYQVFTGTYDSTNNMLKKIYWSSNIDDTTLLSNKTIYQALAEIKDEDKNIYPFTQDNTSTGKPWYSASTVAAVLSVYGKNDDVVQQFAEVVADYMKTGATGTASDTGVVQADKSYNYTISGLAAGYYLIKTTGIPTNADGSTGAYSRYILAMTVTVDGGTADPLESKYNLPKIDKAISDLDVNIGDTVTYYLTASLPTDYASYSSYTLIFHDSLYKGLTFSSVVAVYVYNDSNYDTNVANAKAHATSGTGVVEVASSGYTTTGTTANGDYNDFTVTLSDTKTLSDGTNTIVTNENTLIQVVFTAILNKEAVIGGDGNDNKVYLEYSNNMYGSGTGKTVTDRDVTWTYEIDVTKVDADDTTETLPDAEFVLYRKNDSGVYEYVQVDANNRVAGWVTDIDDASTLTSDANGLFSVIGLDQGTYYLLETKAPSGYNIMSDPVTVEIAATYKQNDQGTWLTDDYEALATFNTAEVTSTCDGTVSATVENHTGAKLPSTGGIGTTIFYIVGGVLVVGAIILLITKKRMGGDDK